MWWRTPLGFWLGLVVLILVAVFVFRGMMTLGR